MVNWPVWSCKGKTGCTGRERTHESAEWVCQIYSEGLCTALWSVPHEENLRKSRGHIKKTQHYNSKSSSPAPHRLSRPFTHRLRDRRPSRTPSTRPWGCPASQPLGELSQPSWGGRLTRLHPDTTAINKRFYSSCITVWKSTGSGNVRHHVKQCLLLLVVSLQSDVLRILDVWPWSPHLKHTQHRGFYSPSRIYNWQDVSRWATHVQLEHLSDDQLQYVPPNRWYVHSHSQKVVDITLLWKTAWSQSLRHYKAQQASLNHYSLLFVRKLTKHQERCFTNVFEDFWMNGNFSWKMGIRKWLVLGKKEEKKNYKTGNESLAHNKIDVLVPGRNCWNEKRMKDLRWDISGDELQSLVTLIKVSRKIWRQIKSLKKLVYLTGTKIWAMYTFNMTCRK